MTQEERERGVVRYKLCQKGGRTFDEIWRHYDDAVDFAINDMFLDGEGFLPDEYEILKAVAVDVYVDGIPPFPSEIWEVCGTVKWSWATNSPQYDLAETGWTGDVSGLRGGIL